MCRIGKYAHNTVCVTACPLGYTKDEALRACVQPAPLVCPSGMVAYNGACMPSCPEGMVANDGACVAAPTCTAPLVLVNGACVAPAEDPKPRHVVALSLLAAAVVLGGVGAVAFAMHKRK